MAWDFPEVPICFGWCFPQSNMSHVQKCRQFILVFGGIYSLRNWMASHARKLFTSFAQAHVRSSFAQARNHVDNWNINKWIYNEKGFWMVIGHGVNCCILLRVILTLEGFQTSWILRKLRASKGVPGHYAPQKPVARWSWTHHIGYILLLLKFRTPLTWRHGAGTFANCKWFTMVLPFLIKLVQKYPCMWRKSCLVLSIHLRQSSLVMEQNNLQ